MGRVLIVERFGRPAGKGGNGWHVGEDPVCLCDESMAADVIKSLMAGRTVEHSGKAKNGNDIQYYEVSNRPIYDTPEQFQALKVDRDKAEAMRLIYAKLTDAQIAAAGLPPRPRPNLVQVGVTDTPTATATAPAVAVTTTESAPAELPPVVAELDGVPAQ